MATHRLPEGIQFIQRGWLSANHLVVDSADGPILIDTGHSRDEQTTLDRLRAEKIAPESLSLIVNTHVHPDHWGGNRCLVELSGAAIACGTKTADIFARNDQRAMWIEYFGTEVYHDPSVPPLPADQIWQSGSDVQLGAFAFEVVDAPGHAPDSIALWQPEHRILVSADALHDGDCGVLHVAVHGPEIVQDALDTVARFRGLHPRVAIPGHGPLIYDVPGALDRLETRLYDFQKNPEKLARHLCSRVLMSSILAAQPVSIATLCRLAQGARWFDDYSPMLGVDDPSMLVRLLVGEFQNRGLVREEHGLLRSTVPR